MEKTNIQTEVIKDDAQVKQSEAGVVEPEQKHTLMETTTLTSVASDATLEKPICGVVTEAETVNPSVEPLVEVAPHPEKDESEVTIDLYENDNSQIINDSVEKFMKEHREFVTTFNDGQNAVIDIDAGFRSNKMKLVRVKINRLPLGKNVKRLNDSMLSIGQQQPILVAPAPALVMMGYDLEDFDGKSVDSKNLDDSLAVIDGQTRTKAYLQAKVKDASKLFGIFISAKTGMTLDALLTGINRNSFTWSAQDYATAIIVNPGAANREIYLKIQQLRQKGYSDTAADEWVTGEKGTLRKGKILKEAQCKLTKTFSNASSFTKIHDTAVAKFGEAKGSPLLLKSMPEYIIEKWEKFRDDKGQDFATQQITAFINSLSSEEVKELSEVKGNKDQTKQQVFRNTFDKYFDRYFSKNK